MAEGKAEAGTLLSGLQEELDLYRKVRVVSAEELALVRDAELEKATTVLARKQEMLAAIGSIEDRIRPLKVRWPELKGALPSDMHLAFQSALRELSELLEQLIGTEREIEEILSGQIAVVRKKTAAAHSEESVRRAYGVRKEGPAKD